MTAPNPRTRMCSRRTTVAGLALLFALSGCKSKEGSTRDGGGKFRDPLVYGPARIPPQNVPVRERDGTARGTDPLVSPTGRHDARTGSGYSDGPDRFKGSYTPNSDTTPAALAAKMRDGEELKIDAPDNRVPLKQAGGVQPAVGVEVPTDGTEPLYAELAKYGVRAESRSLAQEEGKFVFRASVPISGNGARRQYTGVGATAAEAVKQVTDQVVADRN